MMTNQLPTETVITEKSEEIETEVLLAALSSTHALGLISSILAGICGLLIIFDSSLFVKLIAFTGILTALLQSYYFWRVSLDRKLLPVLLKHGAKSFDQGLRFLFPAKAGSLISMTVSDRLQGIRKLFFRQCWLAIVQSLLAILSLVLFLISASC